MSDRDRRGMIAWMTRHRVAPNLVMLVLILGGLFTTTRIQQEVFPEFEPNTVSISVSYPGATPEEIEQSVVLPVESAVQGLVGIKTMTSTANEGSGSVQLELLDGVDKQLVYQEIQQAVDGIDTFPRDAEEPRVSMRAWHRDVMDLVVYGDVSEHSLRAAAEQLRDGLLRTPGVTLVEVDGVREMEIHIDIDEAALRAYGLSFGQVAERVRGNALDRSAGRARTRSGDLLLQVDERRDWAREFADLVIVEGEGGALVRLGDIATLSEGFDDSGRAAFFNGKPAVGLEVFRVADQTPIGVAEAVHAALPGLIADLPPAIGYSVRSDRSEVYRDRLTLLLRNAFIGLMLVLVMLSLFLEFKLAFWVTVGIPTAFLGAMLFLPWFGVSINMISMFAFIIALGIVVDDAIVAGENIYEYRQRGMHPLKAAIRGAQDIAVPVIFSIITNIIAFLPLLFIPGWFGQIWQTIPLVVGAVFAISLVEALVILPGHLGHVHSTSHSRIGARLHGMQQRFSQGFARFIEYRYGPFLRLAMQHRYLTSSAAIALLLIVLAYPMSGRMGFTLMPRVESDAASAEAVLPFGATREQVAAVRDRLVTAAEKVIADNGGERLGRGVYAWTGENTVDVRAYLTRPGERPLSTAEVSRLWRQATGEIAGVESLNFSFDRGGPGGGASLSVRLIHRDTNTLRRASSALAERLSEFASVSDVNDGYAEGKAQWRFRVNEAGRALGLSADDIASQVRQAVFGAEAFKQLRGRDEVTVRVRLARGQYLSRAALADLLIRTPAGGYTQLSQVAAIETAVSPPEIYREDGRRTLTVTANVNPASESNRVLAALENEVLPALTRDYPGLSHARAGRQASAQDAMDSFKYSVSLALVVIYMLLAIPFRSYIQPAIVMMAIPFGAVGAIIGHMIMGYSLSLISVMGMIALGGVVINGALVLIDYANARRKEGIPTFDAVAMAGVRRFRPIMLTTLTTFGGLAPMIFETSRQARFMIPMAISLGYGILFATAILLLLIPCLYMIVEDVRGWFLGAEEPATDESTSAETAQPPGRTSDSES